MAKQIEITSGPLGKKIFWYTVPLAVTGILQQLFNAADIAVVGRFVGKEAMAAVGSNASIIGLLVNLFVGISLGSSVVIANAIGQGNPVRVEKAAHTSVIVAAVGGILLSVLGEFLAPAVVEMLDVPAEVFPLSVKYLRIYLLGMPVILLYNFESAMFRSCGDTKTPLTALVISGVLNVVLNIIFVALFGMDVDGVAIATVFSNLVSAAILFASLLRTNLPVRLSPKKFAVDAPTLRVILRIGVPAGIQGMIFSFANVIIQSAVNSLGATVMAASSAAFNLEVFVYYIMNSFGQACTTFVGQNYGAKKAERCVQSLKLCLLQSFVTTAISCTLILVFSAPLLSLFNTDAGVVAAGKIRLEYIFAAYVFSFALETFSGYLRGFGVSFIPAACSVAGICGIRLVWIFTVFRRFPSFTTVMQVYPLSLGVTAITLVIVTVFLRPSRKYID